VAYRKVRFTFRFVFSCTNLNPLFLYFLHTFNVKESEILVSINDSSALTGHIRDPARVLLLFRDKDSTVSIPMSHTLAAFPVSSTLNKVVGSDVVIFATSNLGKTLKSNVLIDVHLMQDNSKTFNHEDSVKKVPCRSVCQHPLVPLGCIFFHYQAADNAKDALKVLRVACTVDVKAVTTAFNPVPLYFLADLYPFVLPSFHPMFTYPATLKSAMTNPYDFYRPLDHVIPFANVGDFLFIKGIPECLHLACVKSDTDNPFELVVLLVLLHKPVDFDETCYGAIEAAKSFFSGPSFQTRWVPRRCVLKVTNPMVCPLLWERLPKLL